MIIFQSNFFTIDLTLFGITFNEENNMFIDNLIKSYSFPFKVPLSDTLVKNLGFPNVEAISGDSASIKGKLVIDNDYYEATLELGEVQGEEIECIVYYGDEELPVYGTNMRSLPWPINIVTTTTALSQKHLDKPWPEVTHNFPAIYRPEIKEDTDYEDFQFFMNNFNGNDFVSNITQTVESEVVFLNRNVLAPCTYVLEMLTFGFKVAGRTARGTIFQDERIQKLLYVPENFLEKFRGSTFDYWQFTTPSAIEQNAIGDIGLYQRTFSPNNAGTYNIKINLDLDPVRASYFSFRVYRKNGITQAEVNEYTAASLNNRVTINKELSINLEGSPPDEQIIIELRLLYSTSSIVDTNSFEYSFKEGRLNELDSSYSLAEFMPDMIFGEFVDTLKNWFNLDVTIDEEFATIDFVQDALGNLPERNNEHLEIRYPRKKNNSNRIFKLVYGDQDEIMVDRSGQIYSDVDRQETDIITINQNVKMLKVEQNFGVSTAEYSSESGLSFCFYDGLNASGRNYSPDNILGFTARVEMVYESYWKDWLYRRTQNKTIRETFKAHYLEPLNLRSKIFKYNAILLPVTIRKRRESLEYYEIEMESETI